MSGSHGSHGSKVKAVSEPDRRQAAEQVARSFKGSMAAVRRLRGRESHRPGELSDAQYSLLFGLRDARCAHERARAGG